MRQLTRIVTFSLCVAVLAVAMVGNAVLGGA